MGSRPANTNFYAGSSRRRIRLQADVIISDFTAIRIGGICEVIQEGARVRDRMDDLFHEVEAVKAFRTDNDTELESRNAC